MTNEEKKSNEIAAEYLMGHDRLEVTYEEMREAVMEMAKWKDEQKKEGVFPCKYSFGDIITVKRRKEIRKMMVIGIMMDKARSEEQSPVYICHTADDGALYTFVEVYPKNIVE